MLYTAKSVANYFIGYYKNKKTDITPMKIQKLIYFSHGWNLAIFEEALIDELVEAWRYGPVIPSIYHEFKFFGKDSITSFAYSRENYPSKPLENIIFLKIPIPENENTIALLDRIIEVYGKLSVIQLSNLTHQPDTPWAQVWNKNSPKNKNIDNKIIKKYFKSKKQSQ